MSMFSVNYGYVPSNIVLWLLTVNFRNRFSSCFVVNFDFFSIVFFVNIKTTKKKKYFIFPFLCSNCVYRLLKIYFLNDSLTKNFN